MANKRTQNKLMKLAEPREFTVQEAWDKISDHLAKKAPMEAACYFVDTFESNGKLNIHHTKFRNILESTKKYKDMK